MENSTAKCFTLGERMSTGRYKIITRLLPISMSVSAKKELLLSPILRYCCTNLLQANLTLKLLPAYHKLRERRIRRKRERVNKHGNGSKNLTCCVIKFTKPKMPTDKRKRKTKGKNRAKEINYYYCHLKILSKFFGIEANRY